MFDYNQIKKFSTDRPMLYYLYCFLNPLAKNLETMGFFRCLFPFHHTFVLLYAPHIKIMRLLYSLFFHFSCTASWQVLSSIFFETGESFWWWDDTHESFRCDDGGDTFNDKISAIHSNTHIVKT